jgi:signal transduction histidine kinase
VAFVAAEGLAGVVIGIRHGSTAPVWLVIGLLINLTVLVQRHRAPLLVLAVTLLVGVAINWGPITMLPSLVAVFTVAEYRPRSTAIVAAGISATVIVLAEVIRSGTVALPPLLSRVVAVGLAAALGLYLRTRADYVAGLRDRGAAEERVRIARELHDVVAHNVSLMVVQAQALAATGADPRQQEGLRALADLGREAMQEMQRMLGVLRVDPREAAAREPAPGVDRLGQLVERARSTGLRTELLVEGEPRSLSPTIDLSVYRIVQEALTNVIRHANASAVSIRLRYATRTLEVSVSDDGAAATSANGTGHGLVGMRERVALFGGTIVTGPREDGPGYRVHATLPIV